MICTDGETVRLEIGRLFPPQGGGGGWGRISHGTSGTSVPSFLIVRFFCVCVCTLGAIESSSRCVQFIFD